MSEEPKKTDPTPTAAASASTASVSSRPKKKVAVGDKVHLVHARRGHVESEVRAVNKDGTVDLETVEPDPFTKSPVTGEPAMLMITSSPLDPTGTKHDSWHPIEG